MNKEQFKFSISNLINEYTGKVVALNLEAADKSPEIVHMITKQAEGLSRGFSEALNALVDDLCSSFEMEEEVEVDA